MRRRQSGCLLVVEMSGREAEIKSGLLFDLISLFSFPLVSFVRCNSAPAKHNHPFHYHQSNLMTAVLVVALDEGVDNINEF